MISWSTPSISSQIRVKLLLEVDLFVGLIRHNGLLSRLPVGRAHLTVLVRVLEGLDQAERLVHGPADGIVIDLHRSQLRLAIYDKNASKRRPEHRVLRVLDQYVLVTAHFFADVGQ